MAQVQMLHSGSSLTGRASTAPVESLDQVDLDVLEDELSRLGANGDAKHCEASLDNILPAALGGAGDGATGSCSSNLAKELRAELQGQLGLFGERLRRELLAELPTRGEMRGEIVAALGPFLVASAAAVGAAAPPAAGVAEAADMLPEPLADAGDLSQSMERTRAMGLADLRERRKMGGTGSDWCNPEPSAAPDELTLDLSEAQPREQRSGSLLHVPSGAENGSLAKDDAVEVEAQSAFASDTVDDRAGKLARILPEAVSQGLAERSKVHVSAVVAARDAAQPPRRAGVQHHHLFGNMFPKFSVRMPKAVTVEPQEGDAETDSAASDPRAAGKGERRRRLDPPQPLFGQDNKLLVNGGDDHAGSDHLFQRFAVFGPDEDITKYHDESSCRSLARSLVGHEFFDYVTTFVITLNAVSIGVQTDYMAASDSDIVPFYMRFIDTIFCIIFTAELALRICAHGRGFFYKDAFLWNWFDVAMVVMQLFEELTASIAAMILRHDGDSSKMGDLSLLRMLRIVRILRVLRLVRVVRLVRQLRVLVCSICSAINFLAWTVLLIAIQMYLVGVYFTQTVSDWRRSHPGADVADVSHFFGSLPRSVLSLFQAISGGADWDTMAHPLLTQVSPLAGLVFVFYIAFATLAILNVVTGVFVESALQSNAADRESSTIRRLTEIFSACDKDGNGMLTISEMKEMLCDANVEMAFKTLDLPIDEVHSMLMLLDYDAKGTVDAQQFVLGCLRLRGAAKAVDVTTLMFEVKRGLLKLHREIAEPLRLQARALSAAAAQRDAAARLCHPAKPIPASLALPEPRDVGSGGGVPQRSGPSAAFE